MTDIFFYRYWGIKSCEVTALMRERVLGSFTIFIPQRIGKADVFEMRNLNQKWALRMGSQEWHKFPKQPASVGTRVGGLVGILWVSPKKKVGKQITDKWDPHWVLTLKRKSSSFWYPNELMESSSKDTLVALPVNQILRCFSLNQNWCCFISPHGVFFTFRQADQSSCNLSLNFLYAWTQLACKHITSLKLA